MNHIPPNVFKHLEYIINLRGRLKKDLAHEIDEDLKTKQFHPHPVDEI